MLRRYNFLLPFALLAAATFTANADTVNGTGSWTAWTQATLGTTSSPTYGNTYWNNSSGDSGMPSNIGWCLAGGGGCVISSPPGTVSYYSTAPMTPASNISFTAAGGQVTVSLLSALTDQNGTNNQGTDYFGYYTLNSNGTIATTTRLFAAGNTLNTAVTFTPTAGTQYGFYIENVQGQGGPNESDYWFYMNTADNAKYYNGTPSAFGTGFQHSALFQQSASSYYLGLEDSISGTLGDADFNDMVVGVNIAPAAAPEPASTALAGLGLVAFGLVLRRKIASK